MAEQTAAALVRIPIDRVRPGANYRGDVGDVSELAASIGAVGQLQPVTVEPDGDEFVLFDGHRRHAALRRLGRRDVIAIVRQPVGAAQRAIQQLAIQSHARPFDPIAEAKALHALMFPAGGGQGMTREQIAHLVGRPPSWVRDRIALVHLDPAEKRAVEQGRMSLAEATRRLNDRRVMRDGGRGPTQRQPLRAAATAKPPQQGNPGPVRLSDREAAVLEQIAAGAERDETCTALRLSLAAVKEATSTLYAKLGARNAAHAVHLGHLAGLLTQPSKED